MHVFLTGDRGVGKSRAASTAAALLGRPLIGFRTAFLEEDPRTAALYLLPAEKERAGEAHLAASRQDGKLTEVEGAFNTWGVQLLREARMHPGSLILMDELGYVERFAQAFQQEILACLDGDSPVLGVMRSNQLWHAFIREHPRVCVLEVTLQNRDQIPQRIIELIRRGDSWKE